MNKLPSNVVAFTPREWASPPTSRSARAMMRVRSSAAGSVIPSPTSSVAPGASKMLNAFSKQGRDYVSQDKELRHERWPQ